MKTFLKKHITFVLVFSLLFLALIIYKATRLSSGETRELFVFIDGHETGVYSLYENREVKIETAQGYNILVIKDGQAFVSEADCDNQVCVHTQPVRETGGQIVCLPHKVVIRLTTTEKSEIDAVTN